MKNEKRILRSKAVVLAETYKLLSEEGFSGVSVDEVSRRSGVSKATVYRHWPSRSALLLDACSTMGTSPEVPDLGSLKEDLLALGSHLCRELKTATWAKVFPSIIDAAERDADLARLQTELHTKFVGSFLAVLERAQQKGELSAQQDLSALVAAVVSPFFYRRWFSREPLDRSFVEDVVRAAINSLEQNVRSRQKL